MNYKPLPEKFHRGGFDFTPVECHGDIAIFAKRKPNWAVVIYEVVVVQRHEGRELPDGRCIEPAEAMPSSEDWGTLAWSYRDLESAKARFSCLTGMPIVALRNRKTATLMTQTGQSGGQ